MNRWTITFTVVIQFSFLPFVMSQYSEPHTLFETNFARNTIFAIVDYDGDGVEEVVVNTLDNGGYYTYFLEPNNGSYTLEKRIRFPYRIYRLDFYDLDGDGDMDLLSNNWVYENRDLDFIPRVELPELQNFRVEFFDLDQDGLVDIVPGIRFDDALPTHYPYFKNAGSFDFSLIGESSFGTFSSNIAVGDIDGDGRHEIIVEFLSDIHVFKVGMDNTILGYEELTGESEGTEDMVVADITGDGIDDVVGMAESRILAYLFEDGQMTTKELPIFTYSYILKVLDYDKDGVDEVIMLSNDFNVIQYEDDELIHEVTVDFPHEYPMRDCGFVFLDDRLIALRPKKNSFWLYEIKNHVIVKNEFLLENFHEYGMVETTLISEGDFGHGYYKDNELHILRIDKSSHEKSIQKIQFNGTLSSIYLTELKIGRPVYLYTYEDDTGLYLMDATHPGVDQDEQPIHNFEEPPYIRINRVGNEISALVVEDLDLYEIEFDGDYSFHFLRSMDYQPHNAYHADLNGDGMKDILWTTDKSMWYSEKLESGYDEFDKIFVDGGLQAADRSLIFDYDGDGDLEIVSFSGDLKVLDYQSDFEQTDIEIEDLKYINFAGDLEDDRVAISRNTGEIHICNELKDFVETGESVIDLVLEPHLAGFAYLSDLDQDGDEDIVIRSFFSLSVALFGDVLSSKNYLSGNTVFPNPTHGPIEIRGEGGIQIMAVYDAFGQDLGRLQDLSHLPSGLYYVLVKRGEESMTIPISKI